jgi:hypothetical protein
MVRRYEEGIAALSAILGSLPLKLSAKFYPPNTTKIEDSIGKNEEKKQYPNSQIGWIGSTRN